MNTKGIYDWIRKPLSQVQKMSLAQRSAAEQGIQQKPLDQRPVAD